jgi:hypothetical protein
MVTFKGSSRFFSRNQGGKYQLDVGELRAAFVASGELSQRVHSLRNERLGRIIAAEVPVPLDGLEASPIICVHIVPLVAVSVGGQVDLIKAAGLGQQSEMMPLYAHGWSTRFNIDGVVTYSGDERAPYTYLQLFRNGVIESATTGLVSRPADGGIPGIAFPEALFEFVRQKLAMYSALDVPPPYSLMVTLLRVKGVTLATSTERRLYRGLQPIDRDVLHLPDVLIEDAAIPADQLLRPLIDGLWQAVGSANCPDYDAHDRWKPRR